MTTGLDKEKEWLQALFVDERTTLTWPDIRIRRKKATFSRSAIHEAIRELEFDGVLECNRTSKDPDTWTWRKKPPTFHNHAHSSDHGNIDPTEVVLNRSELLDLVDAARRLTHPDVSKAPNANHVTAQLNAMADRLRAEQS